MGVVVTTYNVRQFHSSMRRTPQLQFQTSDERLTQSGVLTQTGEIAIGLQVHIPRRRQPGGHYQKRDFGRQSPLPSAIDRASATRRPELLFALIVA